LESEFECEFAFAFMTHGVRNQGQTELKPGPGLFSGPQCQRPKRSRHW